MPDTETITTLITDRGDMPKGTVAEPVGRGPNIVVYVMGPIRIIAVRAIRVFLQSVIGFLGAHSVGLDKGMFPSEFGPLFWSVAGFALAPTVMSILQNTLELLNKVDETAPQWRG